MLLIFEPCKPTVREPINKSDMRRQANIVLFPGTKQYRENDVSKIVGFGIGNGIWRRENYPGIKEVYSLN